MEKFKNLEKVTSAELSKKLLDLDKKKELVRKVNLFASDADDEFSVTLEDGNVVGIFKTWAVPVIPLLESNATIGDVNWGTIEKWKKELQEKPVLAWETMEKWRSKAELADRRLLKIFNERELPANKEERVAELYWRLKVSFAFAAPFYHIEAMVGDGDDTPGNPFTGDLGKDTTGGFLDMAGMLLPSALGSMVKSEKLNWNNLNWDRLRQQVSTNTDLDKLAILMRVARKAGIKTEEVLFAANALEWIPVSVGGKKGDLNEAEAVNQLLASDVNTGEVNMRMVARDMNGLIRFLNWTPLIQDNVNFTEAAWWKYSAVCETANQLIKELSDGTLIEESRRDEFVVKVLPQLENLDASSARGRFALWMSENGWLSKRLIDRIGVVENRISKDVMARMVELEKNERVIDLGESNNRYLVGGKAAGLSEAMDIFGREFVGDGVVITSEAITSWIEEDKEVSQMIRRLGKSRDIQEKLKISANLKSRVARMSFPKSIVAKVMDKVKVARFAVRSSSFDEDTLVNGSAAGIYESETDVKSAELGEKIAQVVSSFFSEKAVSYRHLHGLADEPTFAVVIHEFLPGAGGVAFSKGDGCGWSVFSGETPGHIVEGDGQFDRVEMDQGKMSEDIRKGWVDVKTAEMVGNMSILAERILGGMTDMEFVVSGKGLRVLQLRMLNSAEEKGKKSKGEPQEWFEISGVKNLESVVFTKDSVGLVVGGGVNIDQFQGELFRCLVKNKDRISVVSLARRIPKTSHFSNICLNLGIKLVFRDE